MLQTNFTKGVTALRPASARQWSEVFGGRNADEVSVQLQTKSQRQVMVRRRPSTARASLRREGDLAVLSENRIDFTRDEDVSVWEGPGKQFFTTGWQGAVSDSRNRQEESSHLLVLSDDGKILTSDHVDSELPPQDTLCLRGKGVNPPSFKTSGKELARGKSAKVQDKRGDNSAQKKQVTERTQMAELRRARLSRNYQRPDWLR